MQRAGVYMPLTLLAIGQRFSLVEYKIQVSSQFFFLSAGKVGLWSIYCSLLTRSWVLVVVVNVHRKAVYIKMLKGNEELEATPYGHCLLCAPPHGYSTLYLFSYRWTLIKVSICSFF
jgi:hypothetical protein